MVIILGVPIFRIFTVDLALIEKMKMSVSSGESVPIYHIPINDIPFELDVFWTSDTECHIKLTFSKSVALPFKTRLMTLLNMPQETSYVHKKCHMFPDLAHHM